MRILHVLDHSLPLHSGYAFRTASILRGQRALGWETIQLTGPKQGSSRDSSEVCDGLRFERTPPRGGAAFPPGLAEVALMRAIERRLAALARSGRPDVLHAHSPVLDAIPALQVGRRLGIPVVYEVRALWEDAAVDHGTSRPGSLRYRATRAVETYAVRRAAAVTTICEGLRRELVARGVPRERVTVVPNAVDPALFVPGGTPDPALRTRLGLDGTRVVGFIGSFYGYEGLDLLIEAVPAIRALVPDARVLLAGGGPEDERLRAMVVANGLGDVVHFAGQVPHGDVGRYYDLIDVLVYPRRRTRTTELVTPLKPLEAMAQGRLVVASDVGGHRELIEDGVTGLLFQADDGASLAEAVHRALRSADAMERVRGAARRFVESERTWARSVGVYRGVYEAVLGRQVHVSS